MNKLAVIPQDGGGGGAAEGITNPILGNLGKMSGTGFFSSFLPAAAGMAFLIGALIFFFYFVTGAIAWISSGGDKQALESARTRITNALIGILLLFAAFAIIRVLESFFGISILTLDISKLIIQ